MYAIKRALISVSKKSNLEQLAKFLQRNGVEIISTGGTREFLSKRDISSTDITTVTGHPECFGGRVKTLGFTILSSLLFDRIKDAEEAKKLNIKPIDLLVCNFYPFSKAKKSQAGLKELIKNIDIGGVTLVRAAAKNFNGVTVLTDPDDYETLMNELAQNNMQSSLKMRTGLMIKAFNKVADYDADIAESMSVLEGKSSLRLSFSEYRPLRYGENPHQAAKVYRRNDAELGTFLLDQEQLNGKDISFNNVLDLVSALDTALPLSRYACCIVKHNTPCGLAESSNKSDLLALAWAGDPVSAFGSVIAFNCPVDKKDLTFLEFDNVDKTKRKFIEVIAAPEFTEDALSYLKAQQNLRIISISQKYLGAHKQETELRFIPGGVLLQEFNNKAFEKLECVTDTKTLDINAEAGLINFGLQAVKQIKSNAIAIVMEHDDGAFQLLGQGCGQPNRLNSVKLALEIACKNLASQKGKAGLSDVLLISEAFFPFTDSIEYCAEKGIKTIVQPGGSIRDGDIISACNKYRIGMYVTGIRHFKH
jgi:phosphoribosylaminoimidazolecarboxamide formyltransferase/IMP cyclohydrolase